MTIWDVFGLARRFFLVSLLGIALTAWFGSLAWDQPGAFRSQVNVLLLPPVTPIDNALITTPDSLGATAAVIIRMVGGPSGNAGSVSSTVSLAAEGIARGHSVRQPNIGSQWEPKYVDPTLEIQSVGGTKAEADAEMSTALASVRDALTQLEARRGVDQANRIRVELSPSQPSVVYVHGSRTRAVGATLLVGLVATIGALLAADQAMAMWARRRARVPATS